MKKIITGILLCFSILLLNACDDNETVTATDLDMSGIRDIEDRKKRFFDFMRPVINRENARIQTLRDKLLVAKKNNDNKAFVARTASDYAMDWQTDNEDWDRLLARVDVITLELALAQSANETAWGQSRFAREGNNFFGQWCYQQGCGMVPDARDEQANHEVTRFKNVNDSVRSYIKNINTGRAYASLRIIRKKNREAGKTADAYAEAGGLLRYSQRRQGYVRDIRSIIEANRLLMLGQPVELSSRTTASSD